MNENYILNIQRKLANGIRLDGEEIRTDGTYLLSDKFSVDFRRLVREEDL